MKKMKQLLLLLALTGCLLQEAIAVTLSSKAEISLLTCSPGTELYSLFGHTAIRINDPQENIDIVFNYGTFDFNTPHFYLKYVRGLLPYQLTVAAYPDFLAAYQHEQRTVYSQTFRLDSLQKQEVMNRLIENYRPENRLYLYNFLFDNCTTRSRDILVKDLPGKVEWLTPDSGKNFWNLLDEYLSRSPWVKWGIHTILGQRGNRKASLTECMFLPDYLMYGLNTARYNGQRLASDAETLYRAPEPDLQHPWYFNPLFVFAAGTLLLIGCLQKFKNTPLLTTTTLCLFLFTGAIGCLIVFLGAFTQHPITAPNWNILWANPLNLLALPFLLRKNIPPFLRTYLKIYLAILVTALPVWAIAQPAVPMASVSLIVLMIYLCLRLRAKRTKTNI
ncbi:MAG: DUF4105 domain-containing protein [Odoribacter sp.]